MPEHLKEFFAVTQTSVYHIKDDVDGRPEVKKIAVSGESAIAVGAVLKNGYMVSVGEQIIVFVPEGHSWMSAATSFVRDLGDVNTQWWGGGTSSVIALFLNESEAMQCHRSPNLQTCDPRWLERTKEVLRAIGKEHPVFSITKSPRLWLMDPAEIWTEKDNACH